MAAASAILAELPEGPVIESTSVAPGGFINIRLRPAFMNRGIAKILKVCRGFIFRCKFDYGSAVDCHPCWRLRRGSNPGWCILLCIGFFSEPCSVAESARARVGKNR